MSGSDATPFIVEVLASHPPTAAGYRTITFRITTTTLFDYETPQDANKDNVYSFGFSMDYRGQTLSTTINVTIADIYDGITAKAVVIEGEAANQMFGVPLASIPDITGDGKPELGVSINSGFGPASAYIITSEFYGSIPDGVLKIDALGTGGTRFAQTPLNQPFPQRETMRPNLLSSSPRAGGGVDLLLSDAARQKFYLFEINQPADYTQLRGAIDPSTITNAITYSIAPGARAQEARLIGDVNGDGNNDIFVHEVQLPATQTGVPARFGIIFGRPATSQSDRARTATFDLDFTYTSTTLHIPYLAVQTISDISGDGGQELLIYTRGQPYTELTGTVLNGGPPINAMLLIKSPVLRGPYGAFDLQFNAGSSNNDIVTLWGLTGNSIFEIDDLDNDGFKSIAFDSRVVDGDSLNAAVNTTAVAPNFQFTDSVGGGMLTRTSDLDGDGIADFVRAGFPQSDSATVIRGARLLKGLPAAADPASEVPGSMVIDLKNVSSFGPSWRPAYLGASGLIAFGTSYWGSTAPPGQIVLVKESDIRASVTTPQPNRPPSVRFPLTMR